VRPGEVRTAAGMRLLVVAAARRGVVPLGVVLPSELDLDTVQHLVSAAAGENAVPTPRGRRRFRDRVARLAEHLTAPPPARW
ncbi:hypothetical protein ABZ192_11680, partial [Streptomyces sp. NPDC006235]